LVLKMSSAIAKVDLESFVDSQRRCHTASEENEVIMSHVHRVFRKSTWHSHIPCKMSDSMSSDSVRYSKLPNFHLLYYTYRRHVIPAVRVKPELQDKYEIAWTRNLGINVLNTAKLVYAGNTVQTIDNIYLDDHFNFNVNKSDSEINRLVGNVKSLTEFSKALPETILTIPDPWEYSRDTFLAIPLYLCNSIDVDHVYTFRNKVTELLRMKDLETGKIIPCNLKFIDGISTTGLLPNPELWGRYGLLDSDELTASLNFWKKTNGEYNPDNEKVYYQRDIVSKSGEKEGRFNEEISCKLDSGKPVRAIYWKVENLESSKNRSYSNYTTASDDIDNGSNPISEVYYTYSDSKRLEMMGSEHFQQMEPFHHAVRLPKIGYNMYSYSWNPNLLDPDIGIVLSPLNAKLNVVLKYNDPYDRFRELDNTEEPAVPDTRFKLHCRMLVDRFIIFKYIKDTNPYTFTVEIK